MQNFAGCYQQTFYFWKFFDNAQQWFAFTPQANLPAHNLNSYWNWRWWDQMQSIFLISFYFTRPNKFKKTHPKTKRLLSLCDVWYQILKLNVFSISLSLEVSQISWSKVHFAGNNKKTWCFLNAYTAKVNSLPQSQKPRFSSTMPETLEVHVWAPKSSGVTSILQTGK